MRKNTLSLFPYLRCRRKPLGAVLILICLCSSASASRKSYSPFADVPRRDPAYKALTRLVKIGIVHLPSICFSSDRGAIYDQEHRTLTRYEFAVVAQRALATLKHRPKPSDPKQAAQERAVQKAANTLAVEFKDELAQLNRD